MGYREKAFQYYKPFFGKYRCCRCHKRFKKADIEVDHIIPKRMGGTDDISNLQLLCRSCNRAKRDRPTGGEIAKSLVRSTADGHLIGTLGSMAGRKAKDMIGIKYKRK